MPEIQEIIYARNAVFTKYEIKRSYNYYKR